MANTVLDTIDIGTNTFRNWVDKTNEAIEVLRNQAVTVALTGDGDVVTGNGFVIGLLGANTITATTIRGGSANSTGSITIASNTTIATSNATIFANTRIYANSTVDVANFIGNSTVTNTTFNSTLFNINSNVAVVGTSHALAGNVNFDSGTLFVDSLNNRVGFGSVAPTTTVTVNGSVFIANSLTIDHSYRNANSVVLRNASLSSPVTIDTFSTSSFRSGKYVLTITDDTSPAVFQTSEILLLQDGTTSYVTEYAVVRNASTLGTFTADISSGNARLLITPTVGNSTIKFTRTLLGV